MKESHVCHVDHLCWFKHGLMINTAFSVLPRGTLPLKTPRMARRRTCSAAWWLRSATHVNLSSKWKTMQIRVSLSYCTLVTDTGWTGSSVSCKLKHRHAPASCDQNGCLVAVRFPDVLERIWILALPHSNPIVTHSKNECQILKGMGKN